MITVHGGHGWLIGTVLVKKLNTRRINGAGKLRKPYALSLVVVDCVRRYVGPEIPHRVPYERERGLRGIYDLPRA
jgi:2,4-dienoyl-CoA reductase-like NADH-dependent reductase (Old Yellow Enzyme family)